MKLQHFSMKKLRVEMAGWTKRRNTSENVFPFRRRATSIPQAVMEFMKQQFGQYEYIALACILVVIVGLVAIIVWSLG